MGERNILRVGELPPEVIAALKTTRMSLWAIVRAYFSPVRAMLQECRNRFGH